MANNGRSIEELKNDALKIKNELDDLKKDTEKTDQEKKDEAENLKTKAKDVKEALENMQIEEDDETKIEIESTLSEIDNLYNEIINTNTTGGNSGQGNTPNSNNSSNQQTNTGNKNFFEKGWDWVKDQWKDVQDKDKRKSEPGKNLLRTAGFTLTGVGAISLLYKGIKALFGKKKGGKEEESDVGKVVEDSVGKAIEASVVNWFTKSLGGKGK